jgi:hypothetical protein
MATNPLKLRDPWLIAVWPGMGNVALAAGGYLVEQLGARPVAELPARDLFEVQHVEVKEGVARIGRMPRNMFFAWRHPEDTGRDLLVFMGEAQPQRGGYAFCHRLIEYAQEQGISRVFTFAAMATQLHPTEDARVFGVSTQAGSLPELEKQGVEILSEGQISGLNGVLLAAAAERQLPGVCLLGELPFFAVGVPNPKASMAVLRVFSALSDIHIDFTGIEEQAKQAEKFHLQLLDKLNEAPNQRGEGEAGFTVPEFVKQSDDDDDEPEPSKPALDFAGRQHIETLFENAAKDRSKAFDLKRELDRLGVFAQYEDRFLDLFKKGG